MANKNLLDILFERYKKRINAPSREEILKDLMMFGCNEDVSINLYKEFIKKFSKTKTSIIYNRGDGKTYFQSNSSNFLDRNPKLKISFGVDSNRLLFLASSLIDYMEASEIQHVTIVTDNTSSQNICVYFNDFNSFERVINRISTKKITTINNPVSYKMKNVSCSIDFGSGEDDYLKLVSSYLNLYFKMKISTSSLKDISFSEFSKFMEVFASENVFESSHCEYLSEVLGLDVNPENVGKYKVLTELVLASQNPKFTKVDFKKLYLKSRFLIDRDFDYFYEIDSLLKNAVQYDDKTGRFDIHLSSWLERQLDVQAMLTYNSYIERDITNSTFLEGLISVLACSGMSLTSYVMHLGETDRINKQILMLYHDEKSHNREEDECFERISKSPLFNPSDFKLIRQKFGYSDNFPSSETQSQELLKIYSKCIVNINKKQVSKIKKID